MKKTALFYTLAFLLSISWARGNETILLGLVFEANDCQSFPEDARLDNVCTTQTVGPKMVSAELVEGGDLLFGEYVFGPVSFNEIDYDAHIYITKWPSIPLYGFDVQLHSKKQSDEETQMTMMSFFLKDPSKMENNQLFGSIITKGNHLYTSRIGLFAPMP